MRSKFRPVELFLSFVALWWGLSLTLPYDTFCQSTSYAAFAQLAHESTWGTGFLVLGTFQFVAMVSGNRALKKIGLMVATVVWIFVGSAFLQSNWTHHTVTTAAGVYVAIGLLASWLYTKVGGQRR